MNINSVQFSLLDTVRQKCNGTTFACSRLAAGILNILLVDGQIIARTSALTWSVANQCYEVGFANK